MSDIRLLHTTDGYDVRRVENKVLIHLGMVRRDGREWVATRPGGKTVGYPVATRRDAVGFLDIADSFRPAS